MGAAPRPGGWAWRESKESGILTRVRDSATTQESVFSSLCLSFPIFRKKESVSGVVFSHLTFWAAGAGSYKMLLSSQCANNLGLCKDPRSWYFIIFPFPPISRPISLLSVLKASAPARLPRCLRDTRAGKHAVWQVQGCVWCLHE